MDGTTLQQLALVMSSNNPSINFWRHGLEYIVNVGGDPSCSIPLSFEMIWELLGFDLSSKQCYASVADVAELGNVLSKRVEGAYANVFRKYGIEGFAFHPDTTLYLSHCIASVFCRDYNITE